MDLLEGCFEGTVLYESLVPYWSLFGEGEHKRHLRKNIFSTTFEKVILKSLDFWVIKSLTILCPFLCVIFYCWQESELLFCFVFLSFPSLVYLW